jgi:uncharacterized protein YprB with RNaseH-like and TPR domain
VRLENTFIGADGVGEKTERRLWQQGVTHWDEFERDQLGGKRGQSVERFVQEAYAHLDDGDARYFDAVLPSGERWRLYENFRDSACFFDIETTGLDQHRDRVTTVSFHQDGETDTLVAGEDLTADALREQFAPADVVVTFNGKRFDVPFLETSFDLDIDLPHLDLLYTCKKLGLSGGLKQVEQDVGIERDRPDISGRDAVRLWHEYEAGSEDALDTLVSYNREDTVNLQRLLDTVTSDLHEQVFERAVRGEV